MKKWQYILFVFLVALFCAGLTWFLFFKEKPCDSLLIVFNDKEKFKVGEEVDPASLVKSSSTANILYPDIKTDKPGEKHLAYIAVGENGSQKEFVKVIYVISPGNPILELKEESIKLKVGAEFNPASNIAKAWDEFDGDLKVDVSGKYDLKKPGDYELVYRVKNSSGKEMIKKLKLIVEEIKDDKPKEVKPSDEKPEALKEQGKADENPYDVPGIISPQKPQQNVPDQSVPDQKEETTSGGTGQDTWLIEDGQTFDELRNLCMSEGASRGSRQYTCDVLYDGDIAIGYQLHLN